MHIHFTFSRGVYRFFRQPCKRTFYSKVLLIYKKNNILKYINWLIGTDRDKIVFTVLYLIVKVKLLKYLIII